MNDMLPVEHCLMAAMRLESFVDRVQAVNPDVELSAAVQAWEKAQATMRALAKSEDGCADASALLPIPSTLSAAVEALAAHPLMAQAFDAVPVAFGLVEFDALMVSRPALWSDQLLRCGAWVDGADRSDERLAACCLHPGSPGPAVQFCQVGDSWMAITDDPQACVRIEPGDADETASASLQLRVVSPPPLVHVARYRRRLLLVDGHHRLRMLRHLGVGFVPAVVSACDSLDDVLRAAPHLAAVDVARWFEQTRPPMLRDHDRPSLVYHHRARAPRRVLKLRAEPQWLNRV
ncbi:MAG: hypothetical protein LW854_03930 [Rubrivivax sp.]|jgi:hypothetical protein|nr:hypothetical protein [Rubrivivax sp.]